MIKVNGSWFRRPFQKYKLGDPTESSTNLGPVVSLASAERIRKQVNDAGGYALRACRISNNAL